MAARHQRFSAPLARLGWVPKAVLAALLLLGIADLIAGVFLRYVMVRVTDWMDWPTVDFFWVEEVGEFSLAWLTLIGAAVGIAERVHFAVGTGTKGLSVRAQALVHRVLYALVAAFGAAAALSGWRLTVLNSQLTSPGLGINLGWLYFSGAAGGTLIALYALRFALGFAPVADPPDAGGN